MASRSYPHDTIRIEQCISFLAGKAGQGVTRRAKALLAGHGVTPTQYALLSVLWELDGRSGSELAERLVLDSATMTGLLDRTEALGLVERRADKSDRRVNRIHLTRRGRLLRAPLTVAIRQLNTEVETLLGPDYARLLEGLRHLAALEAGGPT